MTGTPLAARRCWLLDLDGTLVDSEPAHEHAYRVALAELWPVGLARFRYADHRGRPTREVVADLGVTDPALGARMVRRKQAAYRRFLDEGRVAAIPGSAALLGELRRLGCRVHVVTGAGAASARHALRATGLDRFVAGMLTGDDVTRGKPDPEPYREACRRFAPAGDPGQAVAVEDSPQGVRSALAAGLLTVQVHTAEPEPGVPAFAGLDEVRRHLLAGTPA